MEASIFKRSDGLLQIAYPFNEKAENMKDNSAQARAIQLNVERSVIKRGIVEEYDAEMVKAREAGAVVELSPEEIDEWTGPLHNPLSGFQA